MDSVRPLRDLLDELAGDPAAAAAGADPEAYLQAHGHPGLPPDLLAEALVSYAHTAPPEVAEHLSPFVIAHSGVPDLEDGDTAAGAGAGDVVHGFALLAGAPPAEPVPADLHDLAGLPGPPDHLDALAGGGDAVPGHDLADHDVADHGVADHHLATTAPADDADAAAFGHGEHLAAADAGPGRGLHSAWDIDRGSDPWTDAGTDLGTDHLGMDPGAGPGGDLDPGLHHDVDTGGHQGLDSGLLDDLHGDLHGDLGTDAHTGLGDHVGADLDLPVLDQFDLAEDGGPDHPDALDL